MHKIMKEQQIPLFALETQDPIKDFDFLCILFDCKADISIPLTHCLVLYALEAGECLFCVQIMLVLFLISCTIFHSSIRQ